jgi:hypothetical protein
MTGTAMIFLAALLGKNSADAASASASASAAAPAKSAAELAGQMWGYEACDKKAIEYPYPDDPHDGFPIGSCPPPATIQLPCKDGSKLKVADAEASTFETGYMHPPKYAIDEHLTSRWSSRYSDDQWLLLDLGSVQSFQRLYLVWELAHAAEYRVSTSADKKTWKPLHHERKGDGFVDVIDKAGKGRYIKIQGVKRAPVDGNVYGYSLFEVTVCKTRP